MNAFTNEVFEVNQLPKIQQISFEKLDVKYLYVNLSFRLGVAILIGTGLFMVNYIQPIPYFIPILGSVSLLIINMLLFGFLGFYKKAFAIREKDISYRSGLLFHSITTIPLSRIQHTEIVQGPVSRLFGLGAVKIYTAGGSSSDIVIPGLAYSEAESIRAFINVKISGNEPA
tara:strand:+ start:53608 stop:54123 length:516 start_codon:yes stop_codon:yes gene_type:complete